MDIMQQSACLVVNSITVYSYGYLFIAWQWVRTQAQWQLWHESFNLLVVAWCWTLAGPTIIRFEVFFTSDYLWVMNHFPLLHHHIIIWLDCFSTMMYCISRVASMRAEFWHWWGAFGHPGGLGYWWFCCCWSDVWYAYHCLREFCVCLCFVGHCFASILVCGRLGEKERAGCFAVVDLWVCCCCGCSVALSHSALGMSSVCGFGISWSFSLTF